MLGHPLHQLPTIGAVDPDQPELFTGPAEPRKEETCSRRVRHRGGRDNHGHEEPERIDEEMPFAAFHLFTAIVAALPSELRGLDALAVETASCWVLVAPSLLAHLGAQRIMEALPVSTVAPLAEIPVHTRPLGILMGEHPPFNAPIDDIKERIDHRAHIQLAVASTGLGWGDQIFEKIPFGISEVCRVWMGIHPYRIPN